VVSKFPLNLIDNMLFTFNKRLLFLFKEPSDQRDKLLLFFPEKIKLTKNKPIAQ